MTPHTIHHSSVSIPSKEDARDIMGSGVPCLTPYVVIDGIKQFSVDVKGYGEDEFLYMDTATLFNGNIDGQNSNLPYAEDPDDGEEGKLGGPSISLPLAFRRIHFLAYKGTDNLFESDYNPSSSSASDAYKMHEYYTYVLCSKPIRLNSVESIANDNGNIITEDLHEEKFGKKEKWGSTYEDGGLYEERVIMGGILSATGRVVRGISFSEGTEGDSEGESGKYLVMNITYGVGYKAGPDYDETISFPIGFTTGEILNMSGVLRTGVERLCANLDDVIFQLNECCTTDSGSSSGTPGSGGTSGITSGSDSGTSCCPISLEGMFDCTELFDI